jgi:putative acetyltransferase
MHIRPEHAIDVAAIRAVTAAAFKDAPFSDQTEPAIVDALRAAGALSVSLVAIEDSQVVGHAAFSPIEIAPLETTGALSDWYGLGPVSVRPDRHGHGIGQALIRAGLSELKALHAAGCVVLGDPAYYGHFGFAPNPALSYCDAASPYLQSLTFHGPPPHGEVRYHPGFGAA